LDGISNGSNISQITELGYCGMCAKPRGDTKERAPGTPDD